MPVEPSAEQIEAIHNDIFAISAGFENNRPIQNREGRIISGPKHPRGRHDDDGD